MKKLVLLLTVIVLGTAAFGALPPKKASPAKVAPVVMPEPAYRGGPMGIMAVSLNTVGIPSARILLGGWGLDVGGQLISAAGANTYTIGIRGELPLFNLTSDLRCYLAPAVMLASAAASTTYQLNFGCEYAFAPHLAVFADMTAIQAVSVPGATTWTLGANGAPIYSGARLYL